jgi:hypothetical protein
MIDRMNRMDWERKGILFIPAKRFCPFCQNKEEQG